VYDALYLADKAPPPKRTDTKKYQITSNQKSKDKKIDKIDKKVLKKREAIEIFKSAVNESKDFKNQEKS